MSPVIDTNEPQLADIPLFAGAALRRSNSLSRVLYTIVLQEFVAVFLAASVGIALYYWIGLGFQVPVTLWLPYATAIAALVVLVSLGFRHYPQIQTKRKRWYVTVGVGAVGAGFSVFLTLLFLLKISDEYSRGAFFFQLLAVGAVITAVRAITHDKLRASIARNEVEARRVILVGRESDCLHIANKITKSGLRIQKIIPFPAAVTTQGDETNPVVSCPKDSVFREIVQQCRPLCPDDILILANENDVANVERIGRELSVLPDSLHMMPTGLGNIMDKLKFSEIGLLPTIQLLQQPLTLFDRFIKRALDMIVAAIGLVLLCPLFLLVMTALN